MKRILLLMWVLLLGISVQAQTTKEITVSSTNTLADQIASIGNCDFLIITGELTVEDFKLLNSTTYSQLASVTKLDLSGAAVASISTMSGMNLSGMEYLRLPDGMTSADDVEAMANLHSSSTNAALKMAGSYKDDASLDEIALYSFESNNVQGFKSALMKDPEWNNIKIARLAGQYGVNDLDKGNSNLVFSSNPAEWDFTGANFDQCTINGTIQFANNSSYYSETDPFKEGAPDYPAPVSSLSNYNTNAFYYFQGYAKNTVKLTLPYQITELPAHCLNQLCTDNKENYKSYFNMSEDEFQSTFGNSATCAPLESLIIPNSVITIGYECAYNTYIKTITIGSGVKVVQGGAFKQVQKLEDIYFETGINNCRLGQEAFHLCYDVKHIALSEGIISLGADCFSNSQQLESIRLPETLLKIGNSAFENCLALNSIIIPSNVEKIGKKAFVGCPFTDVYLSTTDPSKIPQVWSCGTSFNQFDDNSTFGHGHLDGWEGVDGLSTLAYKQMLSQMSWGEAAEYYYVHVNGMPVLHYPKELAKKVRASISKTYGAKSTDGYGLPMAQDRSSRDNIDGADLGSPGTGKYTKDGWAQFLLMQDYVPNKDGDTFYSKEYDDVWYTMCFPFDLTDEQLAAAFNEGFNIADFSSVQIDTDDPEKKKLILHFNRVAETFYRDSEDNVYEVIGREPHEGSKTTFDYNIYKLGDVEYHHVHANNKLTDYKTKTFAPGSSLSEAANHIDQAVLIDGYLATAGHPYMIHPNIGVNPGEPKKACRLAGIKWLPVEQRENKYNAEIREVDLGEAKTGNNYNQASYGEDYKGQTYKFIGNWRDLKDDAPESIKNDPYPEVTDYTKWYPDGPPQSVTAPTEDPTNEYGPEMTDEDEPEEVTQDPRTDLEKYPQGFQNIVNETWLPYITINNRAYGNGAPNTATCGFVIDNVDWTEFNNLNWFWWPGQYQEGNNTMVFRNYYQNQLTEQTYGELKALVHEFLAAVDAYENYDEAIADYRANRAAWAAYHEAMELAQDYDYDAEFIKYNTAVQNWQSAITTWKNNRKDYSIIIPKYSYFLGRRSASDYPKFFREMAPNEPRTTGLWTQYSAIIIPNTKAINGIEAELDGKTAQAKGFNMAFNEDFFVFNDEPHGIATLIEKIEKEEGKPAKVEYMDIVVSIDGKIVSRDKTTFEGLPKGVYIINGKKYYVK